MIEEKRRKTPGPVAVPGRIRTTVYLDEQLTEWGKRQPGGLSDVLRRLLEQERSRVNSETSSAQH